MTDDKEEKDEIFFHLFDEIDNLAIRVIMKIFEITMIDVLNKLEKMGRIDESMEIFFNKLYSVKKIIYK